MKKKLFSILLSLAMVVTMIPMMTGVAFAGTITVGDVLDTVEGGFPVYQDGVPENAWTANNGNKMWLDTYGELVIDSYTTDVNKVFGVTESSGNYVWTWETITATFNMQDGKLVSIEYTDTKPVNERFNGVYTAPVTHDLTVTKNDGSAAIEGTEASHDGADYYWTNAGKLYILNNELTVSGTTTEEIIEVVESVTDLTIEDLSITSTSNPILFNGNATLTLVGNSSITFNEQGAAIMFKQCNGTIAGTGSVTALSTGDAGIFGAALTFNQTGTVTATGVSGIYAQSGITFSNGIGKILARGSNTTYGAVYGAVTLGDALTMKGSTAVDTAEANITGETTIDGNNVKTSDQVALSVLIKGKKPEPTPVVDTTVPVELVKATTSGSRAVKLSWNKVSGATKYVVYGNKCGKSFKKLKTTTGKAYTVKKISGKKLKAHKNYKFYVVAYTANGTVKSNSIHFITGNRSGKYANVKSIKAKASTVTLSPGATKKIGATYKMYYGKKHIKKSHGSALRYISNCPSVATVSSSGVVTAKASGTAIIYIQDIGGKYCKTTVTVK